ncbi:MAG: hypothetical protein NXI10_11090 [bacterium]|nr:hypothetical protein [bacterium]
MKSKLHYFYLPFLVTFLAFGSYSQNVYVIDKSERTGLIFDVSNPRSFINLLRLNSYTLSYMNKKGISSEDLEKFSNEEIAHFSRCFTEESTIPLIDEDPNSATFGEEIILLDSATGDYYYAYPEPDSLLFSLENIERIVLEFQGDEKPIIDSLHKTTFFTKKGGEYLPVLELYGSQWLQLDGFHIITQVPSDVQSSIIQKGYWEQLRDTSILEDYGYRHEIYFFFARRYRGDYYTPIQNVNNQDETYVRCYSHPSVPYESDISYEIGEYPNKEIEFIRTKFDSVMAYYEYSEFPAVDNDPDSPTYGEWLYVIDEYGNTNYLYYQDPVFQWVEFDPTFYLLEVLNKRTKNNGITSLKSEIIATSEKDGRQQQVLNHVLTDTWLELIGEELDYFNWGDWYEKVIEAFLSGRKYDLSKQKDRDKLNLSESYFIE